MAEGYTKLFAKILRSTIWQEALEIKVVWITMLALKDRDGNVFSSVPGLAHTAGVTLEQCVAALDKFRSPDPYSSTKDEEGRRIRDIDGGWFIINHWKYMEELSLEDRRAYWSLKQREGRARKSNLSRRLARRETATMQQVRQDESRQMEAPRPTIRPVSTADGEPEHQED